MAHCAKIENGIVTQVVVISNDYEPNVEQFATELFGGTWLQTSYNALTNGFRKNYAGIGYTYDEVRDAFIPPQPYASWVLDEQLCQWAAPSPRPLDGQQYEWSEIKLAWELVDVIG